MNHINKKSRTPFKGSSISGEPVIRKGLELAEKTACLDWPSVDSYKSLAGQINSFLENAQMPFATYGHQETMNLFRLTQRCAPSIKYFSRKYMPSLDFDISPMQELALPDLKNWMYNYSRFTTTMFARQFNVDQGFGYGQNPFNLVRNILVKPYADPLVVSEYLHNEWHLNMRYYKILADGPFTDHRWFMGPTTHAFDVVQDFLLNDNLDAHRLFRDSSFNDVALSTLTSISIMESPLSKDLISPSTWDEERHHALSCLFSEYDKRVFLKPFAFFESQGVVPPISNYESQIFGINFFAEDIANFYGSASELFDTIIRKLSDGFADLVSEFGHLFFKFCCWMIIAICSFKIIQCVWNNLGYEVYRALLGFAISVACFGIKFDNELYLTSLCSQGMTSSLSMSSWQAQLVDLSSLLFCGKKVTMRNATEVMRIVSLIPRATDGFSMIVSWLAKVLRFSRNLYLRYICGEDVDLLDDDLAVSDWIMRVQEIALSYSDGSARIDRNLYETMHSLVLEGNVFFRDITSKDLQPRIRSVLKELKNLMWKIEQSGVLTDGPRPKPVVVYMYGDTQCGKSTVSYPLAVAACKPEGEDLKPGEEWCWRNSIYARHSEQDFWDAYRDHRCIVYDDFGQRRDLASLPNPELFEIIRLANGYPYSMHMAHLDEKANTRCKAEIVFCSSNCKKPKVESLNCPDAVLERIDFPVEVKLKTEYSVEVKLPGGATRRKFDNTRFKEFTMDAYIFVIYDFFAEDYKVECTFDELIKRIRDKRDENFAFYEDYEKFLNNMASQGIFDWFSSHFPGRSAVSVATDGVMEVWDQFPPMFGRLSRLCARNTFDPRDSLPLRVVDPVPNFLALALKALPLVAIPFGVYFAWKSLRKTRENVVTVPAKVFSESVYNNSPKVESVYNNQPKTESQEIPFRFRKFKQESQSNLVDKLTAEGILDVNSVEILHSVVKRNMYSVTFKDFKLGYMIFLVGRIAVFPAHFVYQFAEALQQDPECYIQIANEVLKVGQRVYVRDIVDSAVLCDSDVEGQSKDICAAVIPSVTDHRDITQRFVEESDMQFTAGSKVILPLISKISDDVVAVNIHYSHNVVHNTEAVSVNSVLGKTIIVPSSFQYNIDTSNGDCGAPLIVCNNRISNGKILGIHIAGDKGCGISTPISCKMAKAIKSNFSFESQINFPKLSYVREAPVDIEGQFVSHGKLTENLPSVSKSQLRPSVLYGEWGEAGKRPAKLFDREKNLKHQRVCAYGVPAHVLPLWEVNRVMRSLTQHLLDAERISQMDHVRSELQSFYDFNTAVTGIPGASYLNSIRRQTSPGFPFVLSKRTLGGKADWFGKDEFVLDSEAALQVASKVEDRIDLALEGERYETYYTATLKDELRLIPKVGKPRVFMAAPMDYILACKMYFGGFAAYMQRLRIFTGVAVGINPYGIDWSVLANYLRQAGDNMIAGDFVGFDGTELVSILENLIYPINEVCRTFSDWKEEHDKVRHVLWRDLCNFILICDGDVISMTHGLPSGHLLTALVNSLFVLAIFCLAWMRCFSGTSVELLFFRKCRIVAYGDDQVVSVPTMYGEKYNQVYLTGFFKSVGMEYTMEDKISDAIPLRSLSDITFLKRKFVYSQRDGRWLAPLSLDTILNTPYWYRDTKDPGSVTRQCVDWALRELSIHDRLTFVDYSRAILCASAAKLKYYPAITDFADLRASTFGMEYD
nr:MAG: RNA-dependent RNA polymerase [Army ant associated dicistrovirus 10]